MAWDIYLGFCGCGMVGVRVPSMGSVPQGEDQHLAGGGWCPGPWQLLSSHPHDEVPEQQWGVEVAWALRYRAQHM